MEPDRWREVERLYHLAVERPEGERGAFLKGACAGDAALRQAVESLLAVHQRAEAFLETPALELAARALAETAPAGEPEAELLERLRAALAERYAIEREVGRGGMAAVFLATDRRAAGRVAIKVLLPAFARVMGPERFHREIATLLGLSHANILPLLASGQAGPLPYYVMPYAEGGSLRNHLDESLPFTHVVAVTRDVAAALDYAHEQNIVHRDIKPENVVFDAGRALVCDFGVARAIIRAGGEELSSSGLVVGTPAYMSPEQASGEQELGPASDLYALGCVVYEMLVGEPPFTGPTVQAVLARQVHERPRSLRVVRPDLPPHVERAVQTALAKRPEDRPQSGAEFVSLLT
jgi:serine/threonine protein kinase